MSKLHNDNFKMSEIGRGIWFEWHSVGFAAKNKLDCIHLYEHILMFNTRIRCKDCSIHSNDHIVDTSEYINSIFNGNLTDSEIIDLFNRWLYNYHNSANLNAGKNPSTFPTYDEVVEYYSVFEMCESGCSGKE